MSTEHQVLAFKWFGEEESHTNLISEKIQNFRTEHSYFGSIKLMLLMVCFVVFKHETLFESCQHMTSAMEKKYFLRKGPS